MWSGSTLDRFARILAALDEPADVARLLELAGERVSKLTTKHRLLQDPRFTRVTKDKFALSNWGMRRYEGLVAAIADELEQRDGGPVDAATVVEAVTRRYDARPESVAGYLYAPLFVVDGDRQVRLRRPDEPMAVPSDIEEVSGVRRLEEDVIELDISIDLDHMRGSGRAVMPQLAGWVGVAPGRGMTFNGPAGTLRLNWSMSCPQPTFGSYRPHLDAVGAAIGDMVTVTLNRKLRRIGFVVAKQNAGAMPPRPQICKSHL